MRTRRRRLHLLILLVCCAIMIAVFAGVFHSVPDSPSVMRVDLSSVKDSVMVSLSKFWNGCVVVFSSVMKGLGHFLQVLQSYLSSIDYSYHLSIFKEMYSRMPVITVILIIGGVSLSFMVLLFLVYGLCRLFLALSDKPGERSSLRESTPAPAKSPVAHSFDFDERITGVKNLSTPSVSPRDGFSLVLFVLAHYH